jgi:hypothetical protein
MSQVMQPRRPVVRKLVRLGGERVARLDRRPIPHRMIVAATRHVIPLMFDPESATGLEATFELRVRDPHGGEPHRLALVISGGTCTVVPGPAVSPGAIATVGADDLILMASGGAGWPTLISTGRLELSGDPFLGLRFPKLFGLPVAVA